MPDAAAIPTVKLMYFAWVREKIGLASEVVVLPADLKTVADVVAWMPQRGPAYAAAFARPEVIRTAVDQRHVQSGAKVIGAKEIAFFPPVTGG